MLRKSSFSLTLTMTMVLATTACHRQAGTHPEDMSAEEHRAAAAEAEAEAVEEEAQYDPNAVVFDGADCSEFCFRTNPTEHHRREAAKLRREAAQHRDASHELRVAEERACANIPELHRDFSPFFHRDDITGAEVGEDGPIVVHFSEIPKTTSASLQELVDCHLARNAALGFEMEEMDYCPLAVPDVEATVIDGEAGFDIRLEPTTEEARERVVNRVNSLLAPAEE